MNSPEYREKLSIASKRNWQDPEYREKLKWTEDKSEKLSSSIKNLWEDEVYRQKVIERQNDPIVNKKRGKSRSKTVANPKYTCDWYREVRAYDQITNELKMKFRNMNDANDWIKANKIETKRGFRCNIKWLLKNYSDVFMGYRWELDK